MQPEYWLLIALALAIAEVLAPGTFLIFFSASALLTALAAFALEAIAAQIMVFVAATIVVLLAGNSLYRRVLVGRSNGIGQGPIGEPGVVEGDVLC